MPTFEGNAENNLNGISVMLSAGIPDELSQSLQAQEIFPALMLFTEQIIAAGGKIVFGGHPTITPLVKKAAEAVEGAEDAVQLYQLRCFKDQAPTEIWDTQVFQQIHWSGSETGEGDIDVELGEMRDAMVNASQAAIFIGGKIKGNKTQKPGIRDEYERFLKRHVCGPVYLVGLLKGETKKIIYELEQSHQREPNQLSEKELNYVHHDDLIELIVPLVVGDIAKAIQQ